jgi:hypothetical protein
MRTDVPSMKVSMGAELFMAKAIVASEARRPIIVAMSITILWSNNA